jgi:uncharacterized membrane protein
MNLQSILVPFGEFCQWTFKHLLFPITNVFNWVCIVFCIVAIGYWLNRQKNYNTKAAKDGGIA